MKHNLLLFLLCIVFPTAVFSQSWEFVKECDGIKIFTCKEAGKSLKSYKGVADIKATPERVFSLIENARKTDWWDPNITNIRVILYEKNKRAQYYMVYSLPWPVTDRDLCVEAIVEYDPSTGGGTITSGPLEGCATEYKDKVRIHDYRQKWIITPNGNGISHVVLEGYLDPSGSIPDWISNMLITDSPINVFKAVKQRVER
jgi:hypothetical protein